MKMSYDIYTKGWKYRGMKIVYNTGAEHSEHAQEGRVGYLLWTQTI